MKTDLAVYDSILFTILVLIFAIEFYWMWQDRKKASVTAPAGAEKGEELPRFQRPL